MTTRKEAISYARHFGWTEADAKRAFADIDLKSTNELALLTAMVNFAGPTLLDRQRLQGSQRGLVTKKENYIKQIELEFSEKVNNYEEQLVVQRSLFVTAIAKIYGVASGFGFKDSWVELLLEQYDEYQKRA